MTSRMREVTALYETAASLRSRVCASRTPTCGSSRSVFSVSRTARYRRRRPILEAVLARLRRAARELRQCPCRLRIRRCGLRESVEFVASRLPTCDKVFPAHAAAAAELVDALGAIRERECEPVGARRGRCAMARRKVVILREGRHAGLSRGAAVAATVRASGRRTRHVVPGLRSRGRNRAELLVSAPGICRAEGGRDPHRAVRLAAGPAPGRRVLPLPEASRAASLAWPAGVRADRTLAGEPSLRKSFSLTDWAAIAARTGGRDDREADRPDTVNAFLFLLASEQAVYIEADDSRAYVGRAWHDKELHLVPRSRSVPGLMCDAGWGRRRLHPRDCRYSSVEGAPAARRAEALDRRSAALIARAGMQPLLPPRCRWLIARDQWQRPALGVGRVDPDRELRGFPAIAR